MNKILILEDDKKLAVNYQRMLLKENYNVKISHNSSGFLDIYQEFNPELIILDIKLNNSRMNGVKVFEYLKESKQLNSKVIILSSEATRIQVADAIKMGAHTYIEKTVPFDTEKFLADVRQAINLKLQEDQNKQLKLENITLKEELKAKYPLIGNCPRMLEVNSLIQKFANANVKVLITGESGTGKENVAHHLHYLNPKRAAFPFVARNCAAITNTLADDHLFGHDKGAFFGADSDKKGYFEEAGKGTLFLDEIADFNLENQAKILRVLDDNKIQKVGGSLRIVEMNCIFATNKNLREKIKKFEFRDDLYKRFKDFEIHLPPLRERGDDIIELMEYFFTVLLSENLNKHPKYYLKKLKKKLLKYEWSGNVRELKAFCTKVFALHDIIVNDTILEELQRLKSGELELNNDTIHQYLMVENYKDAMNFFKKKFIAYHYNNNSRNARRTADKLGMDNAGLSKYIKKEKI